MRRPRMHFLLLVAFIVVNTAAHAALVENLTIALRGDCMDEDGKQVIEVIRVVMDGDDSSKARLRVSKGPLPCTWIAYTDGTVSTEDSYVSLRVGSGRARTECHKISAADGSPNASYPQGKVDYDCCNDEPVRRVVVSAQPPLPVRYVRDVKPEMPGIRRHPSSRPCLEHSALTVEGGKIDDVQFAGETIYLQIGTPQVAPKARGLAVNNLLPAKSDEPIHLTRDGVVYRLIIQHAKREGRLSPNAIELEIRQIQATKLGTLIIEVE